MTANQYPSQAQRCLYDLIRASAPGVRVVRELGAGAAGEVAAGGANLDLTALGPSGPVWQVGYVTTSESVVTPAARALIRELRPYRA
ncbi:hypothetical protein J7E97_32730 [Streptomyces sp. ISL-66]|uniref:hypothetical protein n=1 Tax=Streptomyces sp. ISL-66 TaxID=2819186 RepID=UPI001BE99DC4|nr:hypothetical protein [Streptomyces sp. ISL-66]MBT2472491.1 hypothetical protein [Streptomyces sp. ISL-66]